MALYSVYINLYLKNSFCVNTYLYTLFMNSENNRVHWREVFKLVRNDIMQKISPELPEEIIVPVSIEMSSLVFGL